MVTPLLTTKFYIPPVRAEIVARPRLTERLMAALQRKPSVILVSAPAGFGKTMLLAQWLQGGGTTPARGTPSNSANQSPKVAWLSLDPDDNDPVRFFTYLIAALETVQPDLGDALALFQSPQPPPLKSALTTLINTLANDSTGSVTGSDTGYVLVLDDYHLIEQPSIHEALTFLIDHMPPRLRLVIAGRADPPLPLARWRIRGDLLELRAVDLRFTQEETATFLKRTMGLNLSAEHIATLETRTEGWIAGLQLAALSMQGRTGPEVAAFIAAFSGSYGHVIDYLAEEVMAQQPPAIQEFLYQTSILDRLSASLCNAVTQREDSQAILRYLEQTNLFLISLDDRRQWYRYHRLFADFLRSRLPQITLPAAGETKGGLAELHHRAGDWYAQQAAAQDDLGLMAAAIQHVLLAGDFAGAAQLIEQTADSILRRSEVATFLKWAAALPVEARRARPLLSVYYTGLRLLEGQAPEAVEAELQQIMAAEPTTAVAGAVAAFRALIAAYQGDIRQSAQLSQRALTLLPKENLFLRSFIPGFLGLTYLYQGDIAAARQTLTEAAAAGQKAGNVMIRVLALCHLAELSMLQARFYEARAFYQQALEAAVTDMGRRRPIAGMALMGLGRLLFEQNDLEEATRHLVEGIELIEKWADIGGIQGYISLAQVKQAQGDPAGAQQAMQTAQQLAQKFDAMEVDDIMVNASQASLWLLQGNLEAAWGWVEERKLETVSNLAEFKKDAAGATLSLVRALEYLTLAQVYMAQQQPDKALDVLQRLLPATEQAGWTAFVILILILQALVYRLLGDTTQALVALERALALAQPEGIKRLFIDRGRPMMDLLGQAATRGLWPNYVEKLLAEFDRVKLEGVTLRSPDHQPLIEPLSDRELEVLSLVAAGLSNREIAEQLVVAVSTAKTHLNTIYRKLDVSSRTQAVAKARELNLL